MNTLDKDTVATYYIECELDNIVAGDNIQIREGLYHSSLSRLLEALSFTYRANGVFDYIESGRFRWEERTVAVDDITLTGMGDVLTPIIYGPEVQRRPRTFVQYIRDHPDDERLHELKPREVPANRSTVLLRERDGEVTLLDGSHRFLSMMMNGATSVHAYVAVPIDTTTKPMIGDTVFLRLRRLWQETDDPSFRQSIEHTVAGMIAATSNGGRSVELYWVSMGPSDEIQAVGKRLIEQSGQAD